MNLKNLLIVQLFAFIALFGNYAQSMQTYCPGELGEFSKPITSILRRFYTIEQVVSTEVVPSGGYYDPMSHLSQYNCTPKKSYDFTQLMYQICDAGYCVASRFFGGKFDELEQQIESLNNKNNELLAENRSLNATNSNLIQQLQQKTQYAETTEQPQLREAYKTLKNKKPYLEYCKYFGSGILGAGLMGLGIYCYSLLKK